MPISCANGAVAIHVGDCRETLAALPEASVDCIVTSPPYFRLRSYLPDGHPDKALEVGLEPSPQAFVAALVDVFRLARRVLKPEGTCWVNLGDSFASAGGAHGGRQDNQRDVGARRTHDEGGGDKSARRPPRGAKPKDLLMIPARVAIAMCDDGWWLRSDIIWAKKNPMPESVTDRPTKAHEHVFLLAKAQRYFYDARAISEPLQPTSIARLRQPTLAQQAGSARVPGKTNGNMKAVGPKFGGNKYGENSDEAHRTKSGKEWTGESGSRNARTVWTIATETCDLAHFALMPTGLARRCILAGCPVGGTVLDPFGGAGTTGLVAARLGRRAILCELNPAYAEMARNRIGGDVATTHPVYDF